MARRGNTVSIHSAHVFGQIGPRVRLWTVSVAVESRGLVDTVGGAKGSRWVMIAVSQLISGNDGRGSVRHMLYAAELQSIL